MCMKAGHSIACHHVAAEASSLSKDIGGRKYMLIGPRAVDVHGGARRNSPYIVGHR